MTKETIEIRITRQGEDSYEEITVRGRFDPQALRAASQEEFDAMWGPLVDLWWDLGELRELIDEDWLGGFADIAGDRDAAA